MLDEKNYRVLVKQAFDRVEQAFNDVDPDVVEVETSQGTLRVQVANAGACILSPQPSVRQIWLAVAAKGIAFHFNYNEATKEWDDDKGQGITLFQFLQHYLKEAARV